MRIYNIVKRVAKFLALSVFLQIFVTSALAQSDVADEYIPASFCLGDIDDAAYVAADTNEKAKIKACRWLRDTEAGRKVNARSNNKNEEDNGLYFGVATSDFSPFSERGNWAATRPMTYQAAYLNLAKEFADQDDDGLDLEGDTEKKGFGQRGIDPNKLKCNPGEAESEWYDRVTEKGKALFEKKLDKALVDMNVDPSSFDGDSPQRRLARRVGTHVSSLEKTTNKGVALSKVSGLVIINTFEVVDGSSAGIGILARCSNDVYEMTRLMAKHQGNLPKDYPRGKPGKTVRQWISEIKRELDHNFGVKIMRDENGYPLLLAFGHSARRYFGPDLESRRDDKEFALDMSEEEAYAQLAEYVSGTIEFARATSKKIDKFTGYELFDENGQCIPDPVRQRQFKEIIHSTWNSKAKLDNFKGASIKYSGMVRHSIVEGVDIAVSIVAWSPEISTKPSTVRKVEKKPVAVKKASGAVSGTALGDPNDF